MKVEEIMNRDVKTVASDDPVRKAVKMMNKFRIGSVVVIKNERVVGILTERDILTHLEKICKGPDRVLVRSVMTRNPATIKPDDDVETAARRMTENKCKKLPVVYWDKLAGIITATDIVANARHVVDRILTLLMFEPEMAVHA